MHKANIAFKKITGIGALGLAASLTSIYKKYNSGYGFWKATALSAVDILTTSLSIGAGIAFSPAGGFVAGVALGTVGDIAEDAIIDKR